MRVNKPLNILFLGQKPVGEMGFQYLLAAQTAGISVRGVVTNQYAGSGWWGSAKIFQTARSLGIPLVANEQRNNDQIQAVIAEHSVNLILSIQHPWILPAGILRSVDGMAFNIHNAPLPRYKGHNASNHAILNGEKEFCATLHQLCESVDDGPAVIIERFPITESDTAWTVYNKGNDAALKCLARFIGMLHNGEDITLAPPCDAEAQFFGRHSIEEHKEIASLTDFMEVDLKSRACYFPGFEIAYVKMGTFKFFVSPHKEIPANPHLKIAGME